MQQKSRPRTIGFTIQEGDITTFDADVLALKYAQDFYGTDELVASLLQQVGISLEELQPSIGEYRYLETRNIIKAHHVLFVGVQDLFNFDYHHIRQFATQTLNILAHQAPDTKHLMMTIHGAGFGLDEIEAIRAQFAGYLDAIQSGQLPPALGQITIVERNLNRVQRLRQALEEILVKADYASRTGSTWSYRLIAQQSNSLFHDPLAATNTFERAGLEPAAKAHAFIAMPFI